MHVNKRGVICYTFALVHFSDLHILFSAIAQVSKHNQAKFRALANMGDILIKMNNVEEAIKVYQKQLTLSKQIQDKMFEAGAFGWLGLCHRLLKRFDKSLGFHTQVKITILYHNTVGIN